MKKGRKKEKKRWKSIKEYFGMSAPYMLHFILQLVCVRDLRLLPTKGETTLRGCWGSHSTEEWGNITVSSFKSQHHVGRAILITGFLVENDRLSNRFYPLFMTCKVKWCKCTARANFYSFTCSLWRGLSDFTLFTITFHSVSVSDCGVGGVRLHTLAGWGQALLPEPLKWAWCAHRWANEMRNYGLWRFCALRKIPGNLWQQQMYFSFMLMAHTLPCRIGCLLMHFRSSLLPLCPVPYCFRPLH